MPQETESRFMASGDCCPLCDALDGTRVPAGFKPHPGCTCSTRVTDISYETDECEWAFDLGALSPGGMQGIEVTVTCADGSLLGASIEVDTAPFRRSSPGSADPLADALLDAAEDMAAELCAQCPP
jgi:hypothetical protein